MSECSIESCKSEMEKLKQLTELIILIDGNTYKEIKTESGTYFAYGLYNIEKVAIARGVASSNCRLGAHKHEALEIMGVYEGKMIVDINGIELKVLEKELCVIQARDIHSVYFPVESKIWIVSMPSTPSFPRGPSQK